MGKAMKIAIVDDEKDMRQSISQWLALSGYDTETFASAEEALGTVGADGKAVRLVPQALNEIEDGVIMFQRHRPFAGAMKFFLARVAVDTLGHAHHRDVLDAHFAHDAGHGADMP